MTSRADEPIVAVDWAWYRETLRRFKRGALEILRQDRAYLVSRANLLRTLTGWDTGDALDAINQAMINLNRAHINTESTPLLEFAPEGFWLPRCPTCDGSGQVTVVEDRPTPYDYSAGQDFETVVCPTCGLGATECEDYPDFDEALKDGTYGMPDLP